MKIKRDKNQQPFALIQFKVCSTPPHRAAHTNLVKNVEAAELAIQGSKMMNIDGREIRAEKARGNCETLCANDNFLGIANLLTSY